LRKVPAKDRDRANPLASDSDAAAGGAKIFAEHCAECHGEAAEGQVQGKHYRPNLHSGRVKQATPGELFWLLTNGSLRNGMPSWSRLPEPQRWQLVTYLKLLP
jgi:mono/diheme cytochrome c family protein